MQEYIKIYEFKKERRDQSLVWKVRKQGGKYALASIGNMANG